MVREALTPEALDALEPRDAAALFIARRAEGLSSSEEQLLARWLARDESHRRLFASADRAWQTFEGAEDDEILQAMRAHALAPKKRHAWSAWQRTAAAAVVLVLVGVTWFFVPGSEPSGPSTPGNPSTLVAYTSARGEVKELSLPDGSLLTLDADSNAVGRFGDESRSIELRRGRGLFSVKPDRSRPFAVHAGGQSIVAVGTRFDVNLLPDGLIVTLLEGKVTVESADSSRATVTLVAGQQYINRSGAVTIRTLGSAIENTIAWRTGLIHFDDQPLTEVVAVMNRYSQQQIVIGDPDVGSIRVSGQFRAGDPHRFAATLADMHQLKVLQSNDRIELVRAK